MGKNWAWISTHYFVQEKKNKRTMPTLGTKITKIDKAPTSQNKHAEK